METSVYSDMDLRKIIEELHNHIRQNMSLWVQWFTFFVTVNYVGIGWFAKGASDNHAVWLASTLFISQCILGIAATVYMRQWFGRSDRELHSLYRRLHAEKIEPEFSVPFYRIALLLGGLALAALVCAWIAIAYWALLHLGHISPTTN
jgi:hypothetical protein